MNLKEEIYKTIIANCYTEEDKPEDSVIMGDDFDKLTNDLTELVKKILIQRVVDSCRCPRCGEGHDDCLKGKMCYVCDNVTQGN